jgi:hypothetical protein
MIRIEHDEATKKLFFVEGNEKAEVVDPEIAAIFKNIERVKARAKGIADREKEQATPGTAGEASAVPDTVAQLLSGNVLVLLTSALATICARQQDLQADVDELIEDGGAPSLDGHVVLALAELEKGLEPLQAAVQVIFHVTQGLPSETEPQQQAKALHQKLTQDLATFVNMLVYKVQAIHESEEDDDDEEEPVAAAAPRTPRARRA